MKPLILSVGQLAMTEKLVQPDESATRSLNRIRMQGEFLPAGLVQPHSFAVTPEKEDADQVIRCLNDLLAAGTGAASNLEPDVRALAAAWAEIDRSDD